MNIYISGPMTGHDNLNFPAFFHAEDRIRRMGYNPVNPARLPQQHIDEHGHIEPIPYSVLLDTCLETIAIMADAIALLIGWEQSKGAKKEYDLAVKMKLGILILR